MPYRSAAGIPHFDVVEKMIPEILFKYRAINKYTLLSLINRSIWFSSPKSLNDPFDCQLKIEHNPILRQEFENEIKFAFKKLSNRINKTIIYSPPNQAFSGLNLSEGYQNEINDFRIHVEKNISEVGILSLTENHESSTMWGHYADSHKGICIGYETEKLLPQNNINEITHKVTYEDPSKISFNSFNLWARCAANNDQKEYEEIINEIVSTKTDDWKYENEWRVVKKNDGNIHHGDHAIRAIIFGLNCSPEDKISIGNILIDVKTSYFQMVRAKDRLGVEAIEMKKDSEYWTRKPE